MPARNPEDCDRLVCEAITAGDIEAALALYESTATFVPQPGQAVTGTEAIRQAMSGFIAMKPKLVLEDVKAVRSGDIALLYSRWFMTGTGPDGNSVNMSGRGREVVRRQRDGTWRFIIDDPNGGG